MNEKEDSKWKKSWDNSESRLVADYDRIHDVTIAKRTEILTIFQEQAQFPENNKIFLDIGAGNGAAAFSVLKAYKDAKAILIDGSMPQLESAQQKAEEEGYDVEIFYQDLTDPSWTSKCNLNSEYPLIISSIMLHHLTNEQKSWFLKDIYRLLLPGGKFIYADIINMEDEPLEEEHFDLWIEDILRNKERNNWMPISFEEQKMDIQTAIEEQGDMPETIPFILDCFKQAGFKKYHVLWFYIKFAVIIGIK